MAGDVIVRQGDVADRFYVICGGTFRVTQTAADGTERVLRTLARTTCSASAGSSPARRARRPSRPRTDGRLFSMSGEDFLELIGGQAGVRDRLLALYDTPAETFSRA